MPNGRQVVVAGMVFGDYANAKNGFFNMRRLVDSFFKVGSVSIIRQPMEWRKIPVFYFLYLLVYGNVEIETMAA